MTQRGEGKGLNGRSVREKRGEKHFLQSEPPGHTGMSGKEQGVNDRLG